MFGEISDQDKDRITSEKRVRNLLVTAKDLRNKVLFRFIAPELLIV